VGGCGNCCFMKYAALFCRSDSAYKKRPDWDVYDADRDALTWEGGMPCVCHPPCRAWGVMAHMAFRNKDWTQSDNPRRKEEKKLALWAVDRVRENGGIIEHPSESKLFKGPLPNVGFFPDDWGGYTIEIDQFDFGHVAHKSDQDCTFAVLLLTNFQNYRLKDLSILIEAFAETYRGQNDARSTNGSTALNR
jgi:hypothetical protein